MRRRGWGRRDIPGVGGHGICEWIEPGQNRFRSFLFLLEGGVFSSDGCIWYGKAHTLLCVTSDVCPSERQSTRKSDPMCIERIYTLL